MPNKYKRIILKISGEILGSRSEGEPIFAKSLENICTEIKAVSDMGIEVGLVVGGGNIFRGLQGADKGIDRTTGDSMGMLATVINGLAIMDRLEKMGFPSEALTNHLSILTQMQFGGPDEILVQELDLQEL
jgi:uridylate kinase